MRERQIRYYTHLEAVAFKEGVEFVNDSAVTVVGIEYDEDEKQFVVTILDDDAETDLPPPDPIGPEPVKDVT